MKQTPQLSILQTIAVLGLLAGIVLGIWAVINGNAANDYVSLDNIASSVALTGALWGWASLTFGLGMTALLLVLTAEVIVSSLKPDRKPAVAPKPTTGVKA